MTRRCEATQAPLMNTPGESRDRASGPHRGGGRGPGASADPSGLASCVRHRVGLHRLRKAFELQCACGCHRRFHRSSHAMGFQTGHDRGYRYGRYVWKIVAEPSRATSSTSYASLRLLYAGPSIPGEPTGMPGTARPTAAGFSLSRRRISRTGTCPSITYPPAVAVWQEPNCFGMPSLRRTGLLPMSCASTAKPLPSR